ncbi:MAG TPA: MMPL family transporter [Solirubrobacteraceae bacterium]|nr:MMPL family transporter [Solirubrobacteraceae bacterium]
MHTRTFAARAGRWSARNRSKAIVGWLAFVVAAVAIGGVLGTRHPADDSGNPGQSGHADRIVQRAFADYDTEAVLIQGAAGQARSAAMRAVVGDVIAGVRGKPGVRDVRSPFHAGNGGQVSRDGRSVIVQFDLYGSDEVQSERIVPVEAAVRAAASRHPGFRVGEVGGASADRALSKAFSDDFGRAERLSIPITLAILVVAFGALVAAGIPVLLALSAVAATLGLLALPSRLVPLDDQVSSIVLLIGMAVGVDYALFYVRRAREERRRGAGVREAVEIAAATSGRAVLVSGVTVIAAMAGMFLAGDRTFEGLGLASIMVVAVAMAGSVTVLPALLAWLGDRVERGRVPLLHRLRRGDGESRAIGWVLDRVLARPLVSALAAGAVLVALAIPAFSMHTANSGPDGMPRSLEIMRVYDRAQKAFPGGQVPSQVVVTADDVRAPRVASALAALRTRALASGRFSEPVTIDRSADHTVAVMSLPTAGSGSDARSIAAVGLLRRELVPRTIDRVAGAKAYVTGQAAGSEDFNDLMKSRAPLVFAFVLALAFLLLLFTFRSIVVPIKAIALNLLSVGASYGVLVEVFQRGHLEGLLGFRSGGFITAWLPMFLFVVLFGLSMDYHVFIVSRIREAFDAGMPTGEAVAHGIRQTAGVVTSAAAVMVAVFAIFATLTFVDFKMMGVGLATAILIDATLVRAVLLPATMKLLGDWNWYLPGRPRRLRSPATSRASSAA